MRPISFLLPLLFVAALAFLLQHFLGSLAWACLLAVITWPVHQRLQQRGWSSAASAALLIAVLVCSFVAPSVFLVNTLSSEISTVERLLANMNRTGMPPPEWLARLPFIARPALAWWQAHLAAPGGLNALVQTIAGGMVPHLTSTVGTLGPTILANALYLFLSLLTLFVLYMEGAAVIRYTDRAGMRTSPEYYLVLRRLFPLSVRGTALGLCSVALLEGIVLGTAYGIAGAPAPVLLGVITGYMALIPGGAPLSFTLVSLFLLGQGNPGAALGLFSWGAFELFLVDKFVRPKLIGQRVDLPFLAVLFGLLGGVSTIGVLGLFIGPFMMAVLFWWLRGGQIDTAPQAGTAAEKDEVAV
jgi:predicted PurR-regulated permease PerM